MRSIVVSAPGKLMLFGEHAVVEGFPCIVTAIDKRMKVTITPLSINQLQINASEVRLPNYNKSFAKVGTGDIPREAIFIEMAIKNVLLLVAEKQKIFTGLHITTSSEFSSEFGFGSSSAVTVCTVAGIVSLLDLSFTKKEIFDICYRTILEIQGIGSGFDIAAAIYGKTLYFVMGGKKIEELEIAEIPLLIGYSGVKADTVTLMKQVVEKNSLHTRMMVYEQIGHIVEKAKQSMLQGNWKQVGSLMKKNQQLLQILGVSTQKLNTMIHVAQKKGAYGAKVSGAGGGDCMISLVAKNKQSLVSRAIREVGGEILSVNCNAKGVILE